MKRKLIYAILTASIIFSFTACGGSQEQDFPSIEEPVHHETIQDQKEPESSQEIETNIDEPEESTTQEAEDPANSEPVPQEQPTESEIKLFTGDLLDLTVNDDNTAIIKAHIETGMSGKLNVQQNYHNVEDLIKNQGFNQYNEIQYWATARTTTGDEIKVISFTVPKSLIDQVSAGQVVALNMGNYVTDLYIHPALQS